MKSYLSDGGNIHDATWHYARTIRKGRKTAPTPPQHRMDFVSRFLLMVMLAVGLALSGCAPPEDPDGAAQGEQGSEKVATGWAAG